MIHKARAERNAGMKKLRALVRGREWDSVGSQAYALRRIENDMLPTKQWTLTDTGRKLLSSGEIKVKMMKTGCGKWAQAHGWEREK